jgi:predicted TPR repeat methyltransferase
MNRAPTLNAVYGSSTPEDNLALYRSWAATYDQTFGIAMDYIMPHHVSMAYVQAGGVGPVLDIGAGTGLVAAALSALGVTPIDGTDFSREMLAVAASKNIYHCTARRDGGSLRRRGQLGHLHPRSCRPRRPG